MVSLRSSKTKGRRVIIEESSSEQSQNEDSDNNQKKNKKSKVETVNAKKSVRGRKKKQSIDMNEDDDDYQVADEEEEQQNDEDEVEEDDEQESFEDKKKKGQPNKNKKVKQEEIEEQQADEEQSSDDDIGQKKRGRNKLVATSKKQKTKSPPPPKRGRPQKVKQEINEDEQGEDYTPSNSDNEENEDEDEVDIEIEEEEEQVVKKKRGRKPLSQQKNTKKGQQDTAESLKKENKSNNQGDSQIKEKGKRGYKRCKNESCSQLIFIHQKVCPHCSHEHKMSVQTLEKKQKDKKEKSSITFEVLKAFIQSSEGNKKVKIRKKDQLPIQQIKKNALYLDEFNMDQENLKQMFEEEKVPLFTHEEQQRNSDIEEHMKGSKPSKKVKKEEQKQNISEQQAESKKIEGNQNSIELMRDNKYDVQIQINFNEKQEVIDIPQFGHFCVFNQSQQQPQQKEQNHLQKEQTKEQQSKITAFMKGKQDKTKPQPNIQSQNQQNQQQGDWRFFLMNIGYPVTCIGWNYSNVNSEFKDQYLAVGVNINQVSQNNEKIEIYRTMQAYDLLGCHRVGQMYNTDNCILIFQIPYDKQTNTYKEPVLVKNIAVSGTPLSIKWMPKYTQKSTTSFAVLTSSGAIYFYSFSLQHNQQQQPSSQSSHEQQQNKSGKNPPNISNNAIFRFAEKQTPIMKLAINSDVILSCFDWLNNEECNYIVAGDQVGNIYLVQIIGKETGFKMAQYYNNAHMGQVLDVKFYPQSNQKDQIIFASCGYDGLVKIFDIFDQPFPLFIYESCLKSCKSIAWDLGGKYLLVNRDKQQFSQIILSFFSTSISKKVELNTFAEARQLQKINQDNVVTMSCSSLFSQYIFSSNENGKVFGNFTEQNRRISVKKIKKKSSECEGFEICSGQFVGQRNSFNQQIKRVYNILLNDVNSFFLSKLSNNDENDNQKDNDGKDDEEFDEDDKKKSKKSKPKTQIEFENKNYFFKIKSIENRAYITSLELTQSNILSLEIKTTENNQNEDSTSSISTYTLESFLAFSNYGGILHISKVYA